MRAKCRIPARVLPTVATLFATIGLIASPAGANHINLSDDSYTTTPNTPLVAPAPGVVGNDTYSTVSAISVESGPTNGTVNYLNTDGSFSYTPNAAFNGIDQFTYRVVDDDNTTDTAVVTIAVTNTPVAADFSSTTSEDTALNLILGNFASDIDGDALTYTVASAPANGTFTITDPATGASTYTPNLNYNGIDTFTYRACDPFNACDTGTVTLTITAVDDAPTWNTPTHTTSEGVPVSGSVTFTDVDGPVFTSGGAGNGTNGTVVTNSTPGRFTNEMTINYTYTPNAGFDGTDSFIVQYSQGVTLNGPTVNVTVTPNTAPVANDGAVTLDEDTAVTVELSNYPTDSNDTTFTYQIISGPANGTLTGFDGGTGSVVYTPNADYNGPDSFVYRACDDQGLCGDGTITLTVNPVNEAPVANDVTRGTDEDTTLALFLGGITTDADHADDELTYSVVSGPTNGTVTGVLNPATGRVDYTPNANYNGPDSITYQACDPTNTCDTGVITINVLAVNDAPVATSGGVTGNEDTVITGFVTGTDVDNATGDLTFAATTTPTNGTVVLNGDGTYEYTPIADFYGTDSFDFEACDPGGLCDTGTLTITVNNVNDAPVAPNFSRNVTEDDFNRTRLNNRVTDVDDDPSTDLTYSVVSGPSNGTATFNSPTDLDYTPNANWYGTDSLVYEACDDEGLCDQGTITFNVSNVNDAPVASDDAITVTEDTPYTGTIGVTDVDDIEFTYTVTTEPTDGTVTVNATGGFTYTPDDNYNGPDSFTVEVCDTGGSCDTATITVNVVSVNDAPVAEDDTLTTSEDTPVSSTLTVTDVDHNTFTYSVATQPTNGSVTINATGEYTYTPNSNFSGTDTFTLQACDSSDNCDTATITVSVGAVNDAPTATGDDIVTDEDTPVSGNINVTDSDDSTFTFTVTTFAENGTVVVNSNGNYTYNPTADFSGTDSFTIEVCDNSNACDTVTIDVTVNPVNDAPVVPSAEPFAGEDQTVTVGDTVTLTGPTVVDPDGDVLTYWWEYIEGPVTPTELGFERVDGMTASFTPTVPGVYTFQRVVCDPDMECVIDEVTITVLEAGVTPPTPDPVTPTPATPVTPVVVVPPAAAPTTNNRGSLADTGANTFTFAGIGFMLVLAGGAALVLGRKEN